MEKIENAKENFIHIKSRPLRRFLLRYYDLDGDGNLSIDDLSAVQYLEISTARKQLWDETPDISLITNCFWQSGDLNKLPNLKCLVVSSQPVFKIDLSQSSLVEIAVIHCPVSHITVKGGLVYRRPYEHQIEWYCPDHPMRKQ